jgi:hypothetical protein
VLERSAYVYNAVYDILFVMSFLFAARAARKHLIVKTRHDFRPATCALGICFFPLALSRRAEEVSVGAG